MYNNYALLKFKKNLDSIIIDIQYRLWADEPDIKDEYFTKEFTNRIETEKLLYNEDGTITPIINLEGELIWGFEYDGSPDNSFFRSYASLEKELLDEMDLNSKTIIDFDEVEFIYGDIINWLNDRVNRILYKPDEDTFECDFVHYGDNLNKITFKSRYNNDIQSFYKELKRRLMITYSTIIGRMPSPIYKPNLKWEGNDTELIELITAFLENKSITVKVGKTTRKEVLNQFEQIFDIKLKDAESKLSRATERPDANSKILSSLQKAYTKYVLAKLAK